MVDLINFLQVPWPIHYVHFSSRESPHCPVEMCSRHTDCQPSSRRLSLRPRNLLKRDLSSTLGRSRFAHRANSLRRSHTNSSARSRSRSLPNTSRRPHTNSDIRIPRPLLAFHNDESVLQRTQRQTGCYPGFVVVVESDGAATAVRSADRPVLAEVAVVLGP